MNPSTDGNEATSGFDEADNLDTADGYDDEENEEETPFFNHIVDNWDQDIINSDADIVHDEQQRISTTLKKSRRLVNAISKSTIVHGFIEQLRTELNINRSLIIDCPTRWNSTYRLIEAVLVNKQLLIRFFSEYKHVASLTQKQQCKWKELEFDRADWMTMENLEAVLLPFYNATKLISGQKYPTIGLCYFAVAGVRDFLSDQNLSNRQLVVMKELLLDQLTVYFDNDEDQFKWIKVNFSDNRSTRSRMMLNKNYRDQA